MLLLWRLHDGGFTKAGLVDAAWAYASGASGALLALAGDGDPGRRLLLGILASLWGLRLGTMLLLRVLRMPEDGRYVHMIASFGDNARLYLLLFHLLQASWVVLFALPFHFAASSIEPLWGPLDFLGLGIAAAALAGETIADRQLARFRENPDNRGRVCKTGLWAWSRHPNYFFEWLYWWAPVAFGWHGPMGAWTLIGPALMLIFLYRVTGIPSTEMQALRSRGDAYRDYQRRTSAFFPLPPRRNPKKA